MKVFEAIATTLESVVFFDVLFFTQYKMPIVIFCILLAVAYFTIKLKFINFRGLKTSVKIFFEKENEIDGNKAVTSRSAFLSAISGCVGVGSISGVAAALFSGGPGAVFWMLVVGILIMPVRYAEVFLGHFFREKERDGTISSYGPYAYIKNGLIKEGYSPKLSRFLFLFYAIALLFGSIGAFLMQANPIAEITSHLLFQNSKMASFMASLAIAVLSIVVVTGGLKRIIHTLNGTVSVMSVVYILSIGVILVLNFKNIPSVVLLIIASAFDMKAVAGGILGIFIVSFTRIAVATEVGFGTVSLIHGKSQNNDSVREGLLSMVGPFAINFIFITLNSVAVLASLTDFKAQNGIVTISTMFASVHSLFPFLLLLITFLFGFTTIVAWYFYAVSSLAQITKSQIALRVFQVLFFILIAISGLVSFGVVIRIIDAVVMSMVFPNLIALVLLGGLVARELQKSKYLK
jgi:AGCS family alanine or glycine:cation symporter